MIVKDYSSIDSRSYAICLSDKGKKIVKITNGFANPIKRELEKMEETDLVSLLNSLSKLIFNMNRIGILSVQRTCYACKFYKKTNKKHFCSFLEKTLLDKEIRLDCPEFEIK